jgi:feruloyl esterase
MEFMTPPDPTRLDTLRERGGKMIVVHGASDGVFSVDDTASWYDELDANYHQKADQFVRYFEVPGMGHVRGGPATDQYEGLTALIDWVENGSAPDRMDAWVNPANADVPASWPVDLSRPLCPYPSLARYASGDPDSADSFVCKHSGGGIGRG